MKLTALPAPAVDTIGMIVRGPHVVIAVAGEPARVDDALAAIRLEWRRL